MSTKLIVCMKSLSTVSYKPFSVNAITAVPHKAHESHPLALTTVLEWALLQGDAQCLNEGAIHHIDQTSSKSANHKYQRALQCGSLGVHFQCHHIVAHGGHTLQTICTTSKWSCLGYAGMSLWIGEMGAGGVTVCGRSNWLYCVTFTRAGLVLGHAFGCQLFTHLRTFRKVSKVAGAKRSCICTGCALHLVIMTWRSCKCCDIHYKTIISQ